LARVTVRVLVYVFAKKAETADDGAEQVIHVVAEVAGKLYELLVSRVEARFTADAHNGRKRLFFLEARQHQLRGHRPTTLVAQCDVEGKLGGAILDRA